MVDESAEDATQQESQLNRIMVLWPLLLAVAYILVNYTLTSAAIAQAEDDIKEIQTMQKDNVSEKVLQLTLDPLKATIQLNSKTLEKIEARQERIETQIYELHKSQNEILKYLKDNNGNSRAHTGR